MLYIETYKGYEINKSYGMFELWKIVSEHLVSYSGKFSQLKDAKDYIDRITKKEQKNGTSNN